MLTNKYTKCCHHPLYSFGSHLDDGIWKFRENSSIHCFFPLATAPHTKTDANWIYQRKQGWMTFKENTNLMGNSQNWKICVQINFCHPLVTLSSDGLRPISLCLSLPFSKAGGSKVMTSRLNIPLLKLKNHRKIRKFLILHKFI